MVNVNDTRIGLPTIAGTAQEDQVLTADTSGISDDDGLGTFNYQWLRNGVAITGAAASTYTSGRCRCIVVLAMHLLLLSQVLQLKALNASSWTLVIVMSLLPACLGSAVPPLVRFAVQTARG